MSSIGKTVAIVGAGPAGLASAKALFQANLSPRIFEAKQCIGGTWSLPSPFCRPSMPTNLSKHAVCFSDFAWPPNTPMFPSATQVGDYLSAYAKRYLDPSIISLGCQVTSARISDLDGRWILTWRAEDQHEETAQFDYLILASGFFSEPYIPFIQGLDAFTGFAMHSSLYRSPEPFRGKHVAIVGGSLSATEVAADIAPHAASVHHVITRPFWVVPRYLPVDPSDPGSAFLPLDLALYRRLPPQDPPTPEERWLKANQMLRSVCGDQSLVSGDLDVTMEDPPFVAVSDAYSGFVRDGRIALHTGRLISISPQNVDGASLTLSPPDSRPIQEDITHIVLATGFSPCSVPSILAPSILSSLEFSPDDRFMPFLLHHRTLHPALPNAAFVGFYRGPNWAIIELQARWCARLFSESMPWPSADEFKAGIEAERAIRDIKPRPHFPIPGYVNFAIELAEIISAPLPPYIHRDAVSPDSAHKRRAIDIHDVFVAPHIPIVSAVPFGDAARSPEEENRMQLATLADTLSSSANEALFVAAAVFRALHGPWMLERTYTSRNAHFPSGSSCGTARFVQRVWSSGTGEDALGSEDNVDINDTISPTIHKNEYLYSEATEMITDSGQKLPGTQRYIYRYDESQDTLQAFFVKRDDAASVDRFFHRLIFDTTSKTRGPWVANASHLCICDNYEAKYTFFFEGVELAKWGVRYEVSGPKKDYSMETWYTRNTHTSSERSQYI